MVSGPQLKDSCTRFQFLGGYFRTPSWWGLVTLFHMPLPLRFITSYVMSFRKCFISIIHSCSIDCIYLSGHYQRGTLCTSPYDWAVNFLNEFGFLKLTSGGLTFCHWELFANHTVFNGHLSLTALMGLRFFF